MSQSLAIITPSFRRDFERCRLTVQSVNRFVPPDVHHYLVIDRRDVAMFRPLSGPRTTIIVAEDLLPWWIVRLPRVRKLWMSFRTLPVRSWIVQQLMKLSVASQIDAQVYCFVDSDVVFVRPMGPEAMMEGERVRLFRRPGHADQPKHHRWHRTAAKLLGLPPRDYFGADYIGNMITWRRDTLLALHRHIEQSTGRHWLRAVASQLHLSEYILYGVYVEHVAQDWAAHYPDESDLCHCSWHYPVGSGMSVEGFLDRLEPFHRAVLIQSNLGLDAETYDRLLAQKVEQINEPSAVSASGPS